MNHIDLTFAQANKSNSYSRPELSVAWRYFFPRTYIVNKGQFFSRGESRQEQSTLGEGRGKTSNELKNRACLCCSKGKWGKKWTRGPYCNDTLWNLSSVCDFVRISFTFVIIFDYSQQCMFAEEMLMQIYAPCSNDSAMYKPVLFIQTWELKSEFKRLRGPPEQLGNPPRTSTRKFMDQPISSDTNSRISEQGKRACCKKGRAIWQLHLEN